jgi:hypothetical protein
VIIAAGPRIHEADGSVDVELLAGDHPAESD